MQPLTLRLAVVVLAYVEAANQTVGSVFITEDQEMVRRSRAMNQN
ncbi:hypothetical protein OAG39_02450 [Verrucomicrobiales bacterium]|nr:hypothetical protein [Verrucomicrobiales bacterium]